MAQRGVPSHYKIHQESRSFHSSTWSESISLLLTFFLCGHARLTQPRSSPTASSLLCLAVVSVSFGLSSPVPWSNVAGRATDWFCARVENELSFLDFDGIFLYLETQLPRPTTLTRGVDSFRKLKARSSELKKFPSSPSWTCTLFISPR
ncbi:hypothetical protein NL676_000351 [Syzygium grande]|nr:hypothetical protein NL676_000351 [Syzygium grande]